MLQKRKIKGKSLFYQLAEEISTMRLIDDVNIVRLEEIIDDKTSDKLYLGMNMNKF